MADGDHHPFSEDQRATRSVRAIAFLSREFERVCRDAGMSLPQYRLLLFMRHGPKRAGELAARAAIKRPTLTALVAGLEKEGLLRRARVEIDRRGIRLELTPEGMEALRDVEARLAELVDDFCGKGDRDSILDSLDELASVVEKEVETRIRSR